MGAVLSHHLHDNLRSLRFQVSVAVLLLFFASNGLIYAMKIDRLDEENRTIAAGQQAGNHSSVLLARSAIRVLVDMKRVIAGRQVAQVGRNDQTMMSVLQRDRTNRSAAPVRRNFVDWDNGFVGKGRGEGQDRGDERYENSTGFHVGTRAPDIMLSAP